MENPRGLPGCLARHQTKGGLRSLTYTNSYFRDVDVENDGHEEWAHSQYFTTRPSTHTIVIVPRGESHERALEILGAVTVKDGKKIVIGEETDETLRRAADIYFPIVGLKQIKEEFSPLVYAIPLELLAMHISDHLGRSGFDFENKPWVREENFRQIFGSRIVTLKEKEDGK